MTPLRLTAVLAIVATSAVAVVLTSTVLLWHEMRTERREEDEEIAALVRHVAGRVARPLAESDARALRDSLSVLEVSKEVTAGVLFDAGGARRADLAHRGPWVDRSERPLRDGLVRAPGQLEITHPVEWNGRRVGTLSVRAGVDELGERLLTHAPWLGFVLLATTLLAFGLDAALLRRTRGPMLALAETARAVAERGDLALRAPEAPGEELRALTADFNAMLARFEQQDRELREAHDELGMLVQHGAHQLQVETLERQRAEDRSVLLSRAIESSHDLVSISDLDDRISYVNRAFLDAYGYEEGEVVGRGIELFDSPHNPPGLREAIFDGTRVGGWHGELLNRRSDGTEFPIVLSTSLVRDEGGRIVGLLGVAHDVTRRRETEARVRLLRAALEATVDSVVIADARARIEWVNAGFTRLTGFTADETVGRRVTRLASAHQVAPYPEDFWSTLREGRVWKGEMTRGRKDGSRYHEELTVTPVRDDAGRVAHFVGIQRDVSERRRLEAQVRQATKMEAVGRLAGGVAHDFNNLLSVIRGHGELGLREMDPGSPGRVRIEGILDATGRAAALTRQLLAFSRRQVMEPRVLDLNDVVRGVERLLRPLVGEDIEMKLELRGSLGRVRADPNQVDQVLMNLAANARDAMPSGGRLTLETDEVVLDEGFCREHAGARPGPFVALRVSDTGAGIDPDVIGHLFEPFFTTKELGRGTGLGLATVYGIVKQSDGYVSVDSVPGRGTTVTVYLPRVEDEARPVPRPAKPIDDAPAEATVLLVEDEDCLRPLAAELLESRGFRVLAAGSGKEALALAHEHEVQLLLTDVVMPGMSGPQLASTLRQTHPGMRVLYMSGYLADAIARHGALEEGTLLLHKPFSSAELCEKVLEALSVP